MRYATTGPFDLQVWLERAADLYRYFFNTPRRRVTQQGVILSRSLPRTLS